MFRNRSSGPIQPFPVHGWPMDAGGKHRFTLGQLMDCSDELVRAYARQRKSPRHGAGAWECQIPRDALTWSDEVYDIFGVPRGTPISRAEALTYYCVHSRAVMERLRATAIKTKQGFVLDAEMRPGHGPRKCWMRMVAVPVCENGKVVRLQGFKQLI